MNVTIETAPLLLRFIEAFGLPDVTTQLEDEVFGPYHFEGRTTFVRYRSPEERWEMLVDAVTPGKADTDISRADVTADSIACLKEGPRPALPADMSRRIQDEPFVFIGSRYAWTFFPELRG